MFRIFPAILLFIWGTCINAQQKCNQASYLQQSLNESPELKNSREQLEAFITQRLQAGNSQRIDGANEVITIPVVFHILYHLPSEDINEATVQQMLNALNRDFRRHNPDSVNTPSWFKPVAADMEIEFKLATMDPLGRSTTGIIKKYTPVNYWFSDDKMKFSKSSGDDAWDTKSYFNIWICNMQDVLGYSSLPGMDETKDGVVISTQNFLVGNKTTTGVNDNRVLIHETGHWLNLLHTWGDSYCGNDFVDDTPKQSIYTTGCPNGARISCSNSPSGDMYMNYMDFTDDACMNMFTEGQKERSRILFQPGGPRYAMLSSKGLNISSIPAASLPDSYPHWMYAQVYPNPATTSINISLEYDERWIGHELQVVDMNGKVMMKKIINSKIQELDISRLPSGVYFVSGAKEGERIHSRFVKF